MPKLHDKRLGDPPETGFSSIPYELARIEADVYKRLMNALSRCESIVKELRSDPGNEEISLALSAVSQDAEAAWEDYAPVHSLIWQKFWMYERCKSCSMFLRKNESRCEHCDDGKPEIPELLGGLKGMTAVGTAKRRLKR